MQAFQQFPALLPEKQQNCFRNDKVTVPRFRQLWSPLQIPQKDYAVTSCQVLYASRVEQL